MVEPPKRSWFKYDGKEKWLTENCLGCGHYRKTTKREYCFWGLHFKMLIEPEKDKRNCHLLKEGRNFRAPTYFDEWIVKLSKARLLVMNAQCGIGVQNETMD